MRIKGIITAYDGKNLTISAPFADQGLLVRQAVTECEVRLDDGRTISADQRQKIYATLRDISMWSGHTPEFLKELLKYNFIAETGAQYFSLSDCSMTTAREFLSFILEFCVYEGVPLTGPLLDRSPDVGRSLYCCLANKVCCICGKKGELHHVDAVGMGRDRDTIIHEGMEALPLCRIHHGEFHNIGRDRFFSKYHVFGIRLDKYLCSLYGLRKDGKDAQ